MPASAERTRSGVSSTEPVSQITHASMCGRTDARQRSITAAPSRTIMQSAIVVPVVRGFPRLRRASYERLARLTLVTALWDLVRRERNPRRTSMEDYLRHAEFLFALRQDVVFFLDGKFARHVAERRAAHGLSERTAVVTTSLEEREPYAALTDIAEARRRGPVWNASPDKDTPTYVALTWSKFDVLREAIGLDPFGAGHFGWIDFGLGGVVDTVHHAEDGVFDEPPDGIRLLMMRPFTADQVLSPAYFDHLWGHVAAGYVAGDRASAERLCELFAEEARVALARGRAPSEEQLL